MNSKMIFGKEKSSEFLFSNNFNMGLRKAIPIYFSFVYTVATARENRYAGTDILSIFVNMMTPFPAISYSTYNTLKEKYNKYYELEN